jgi:tRNA/rRNA methyltransferase
LNPNFCSLNLGQAVLLVAYAYFSHRHQEVVSSLHMGKTQLAQKIEIQALFTRVVHQIQTRYPDLQTPRSQSSWLSFESFLNRCPLTLQEVQSLHRIVDLLGGREEG